MINIGKLEPSDRAVWEDLFRAYVDFYQWMVPPEMYERAWDAFQEDTRLHAFGAWLDGRLAGITHFFIHPNTLGPDVCYLQDLFTAPEARRKGIAHALIEAVTDWALVRGCCRVCLYIHEFNSTARRLCSKVAENRGVVIMYHIDPSLILR